MMTRTKWCLFWTPALQTKTAEQAVGASKPKGETLSIILRIPEDKAKLVQKVQDKVFSMIPKMGQREQTPHITLSYATGMTKDSIDRIVPKLKATMAQRSFHLVLGPIQELTNHKGELVIYLAAGHPALAEVHGKLRRLIEPAGGKFTWPDFKGHVTLGYRDTALTDTERQKLKLMQVSIPVTITPREVDITRKQGDNWLKLAHVEKPWILLDLEKKAEEPPPFAPDTQATCPCGYESEEANTMNELRHLVQGDGGVVRWASDKFDSLCPECGRQLELK